MRHIIIIIFVFFQLGSLYGQNNAKAYNLQECIDLALKQNLDLKSAKLSSQTAEVNFKRSRNELLPTINGSYNIGKTSGRSIDPFTNSYIDEKLTFSNAGLNLEFTVFKGFQLLNQWRQEKLNWKAAEMEREDRRQNLILNVTLSYLQVVNTKDLYEIAESRLQSTNEQLQRLSAMFTEDIGNPAEYRDFQGLKANDDANLIMAKNNFEDAKTQLKGLLNSYSDFNVAAIDIPDDFSVYEDSYQEVYTKSLENMAIVKAGEFRFEASKKAVSVARSNYVPQLSFFANLNTNYSSVAKIFNETGTSIVETGDYVNVGGLDYPVLNEQSNFASEDISYKDQFENNLYSAVGIQVNIPLFNGFETKNRVEIEKINREEASLNLERIKLQLHTAIEQTYNDMRSAYDLLQVLHVKKGAYEESLRINEIRFTNGVDNSVNYIISKNNLETARVNLNNVKYEYLLRLKLLDFYTGQQ